MSGIDMRDSTPEQTIDEMQIPRAATPRTNNERAGEMRFGARRKKRLLLHAAHGFTV